jgi:hypothetical protein
MITAEEFFLQNNGQHQSTSKMMIAFAQMHVEQALKEAVESVNIYDYAENKDYSKFLEKESILNAYPLTNIK